ncbi:MAG: hypothetical protein JXR96_12055 [Deltaproteobacteria bacterium]|nr:hypothetical protein [Deltaproteobacteria bacterium]
MSEKKQSGMGVVIFMLVVGLMIWLFLKPAEQGQADGGRPADGELQAAAEGLPPERGPHPQFPTAELAGTAGIFLLEEPSRGPHVTEVEIPDSRGLSWSFHVHCELALRTMACSRKLDKPPQSATCWALGRRQGEVVLAEHRGPMGLLLNRCVFVHGARGGLLQLVGLDSHGQVEWARVFGERGEQFQERLLDGSNALDGCGRMAIEVDGKGFARELRCLQYGGQPMLDTDGIACVRFSRDDRGFVLEEVRLDLGGQPVAAHDGVSRIRFERDEQGRISTERYFTPDGVPVLSSRSGCYGRRFEYCMGGIVHARTCLGADGEPAPDVDGVSTEHLTIDVRGCAVERLFLGPDGKPTSNRFSLSAEKAERDAHCQLLRRVCLDSFGQPVACGPGQPAEMRFKRDDRGRHVSVSHFAADGSPGVDGDYGVFELRLAWDDLGRLVREACFDASGQAIACGGTGFHAIVKSYDSAGRVTEARFLGTQGQPASNLGTMVRRFRYDNYDHQVESLNHAADGTLADSLGMSIQRRLYDPGHRLFAVLLYDKDDAPARYTGCFTGARCPERPWHAVRVVRTPNGRVDTNLFFDADRQLVLSMDCTTNPCWR